MHITLNLNTEGSLNGEGQIELFLETDRHQPNPPWAVKWVGEKREKISAYRGLEAFFSAIDGHITLNQNQLIGDKETLIESFLKTLIEWGKNDQISTKPVDQTLYCSSFAIQSVEQAQALLPHIKSILVKNKITADDFERLKENTYAVSASNKLSSKDQFILAHNKYCSQDMRFFGPSFNKSNYANSELSEIVQNAKDPKSSCRAVFVDLGWMKQDGALTDNAPTDIFEAYQQDNISDIQEPLSPSA